MADFALRRYHEATKHSRESLAAGARPLDGAELVTCMIEHGIGVSNEAKIEIKRLDNDYFEKE